MKKNEPQGFLVTINGKVPREIEDQSSFASFATFAVKI